MKLESQIESILFAGAKPFSVKRLAELTEEKTADVEAALKQLRARFDEGESGMMLQNNGSSYEIVTRPEAADLVSKVVQEEATGELTRPSLEALTVLAYCGPMTRPELEQIRGVQSSLILRNLMLRGLVEEREESRLGQPVYSVTFEFLNHLGVQNGEALPDYDVLRGHSAIADVLSDLDASPAADLATSSAASLNV